MPRTSAPGTRSVSAACSARSITASAKSDRSRVASTKSSSPERSPSATASAMPARRRRSSLSMVSACVSSARVTASPLPCSTNADAISGSGLSQKRRKLARPAQRVLPSTPANRCRTCGGSSRSSHFSRNLQAGRSFNHRPWRRSVDPMVRRKSTWTVESSASIFRQHMPASRPHSGEPSRRRMKTLVSAISPSSFAG
jgi:hypothetical protein